MIIEKLHAGNAEPRKGDIIGKRPVWLLAGGTTTARVGLRNANSGEAAAYAGAMVGLRVDGEKHTLVQIRHRSFPMLHICASWGQICGMAWCGSVSVQKHTLAQIR